MGASKTEQFTHIQRSFARTAKAIGHPARVAIIQHLTHVSFASNLELMQVTRLSETTVHQHLQELARAGLISGIFFGKLHYYGIHHRTADEIENLKKIFG
jgi:predicted transcriptional regulator